MDVENDITIVGLENPNIEMLIILLEYSIKRYLVLWSLSLIPLSNLICLIFQNEICYSIIYGYGI